MRVTSFKTLSARYAAITFVLLISSFLVGCGGSFSGASGSPDRPARTGGSGNGSRLEFLGRCDTGAEAHSVALAGDTAYVALGLKGLAVVDIANPRAPRLVQWMKSGIAAVFVALDPAPTSSGGGEPRGIGISASLRRALVADRYEGIQILDITRKHDPVVAGKFVLPPFPTHLAVTPTLVYAACGGEGFHILRKDLPTSAGKDLRASGSSAMSNSPDSRCLKIRGQRSRKGKSHILRMVTKMRSKSWTYPRLSALNCYPRPILGAIAMRSQSAGITCSSQAERTDSS
jgi:hypothetical protein